MFAGRWGVREATVKGWLTRGSRGLQPSDALARELQEHVEATATPNKYPRIVGFAESLPRTTSRKLRRSALR
jgi:acyl-coenzyme A synthetase/AMP-(fatty) acid ligase